MFTIKCKNCGTINDISPNATTYDCAICGSIQTLPCLTPDNANKYERADQLRRGCNYDKASIIYQQILESNPNDPEAYWMLVLCKYGIDYVEDPFTHEYKPTINRTQIKPVTSNPNYKQALMLADEKQKAVYQAEAEKIDKIQQDILEISQSEEPFDIFISYKESDNMHQRTTDSAIGFDLYNLLQKEGYKVFFARETLKDKIGQSYEPYIFAALQSAKIMLVLGTQKEYFTSPWVRNEWSRYLGLINQGMEKTLIPVYKDMDPYDLPEEFNHLQSINLGDFGASYQLVNGLKKLTHNGNNSNKQNTHQGATQDSNNKIKTGDSKLENKLKRAFILIEDGDFNKASTCLDEILEEDPENGKAYLGLFLIENNCHKIEEIEQLPNNYNFDLNKNFQRALRYGDADLTTQLNNILHARADRIEEERQAEIARLERERLEEEARQERQRLLRKQEELRRQAEYAVRKKREEEERLAAEQERARQLAERQRKEEEEERLKQQQQENKSEKSHLTGCIIAILVIVAIINFIVVKSSSKNNNDYSKAHENNYNSNNANNNLTREVYLWTETIGGRSYKVAKINDKVWMAENLQNYNVSHHSVDGDNRNNEKYGYLYTWKNAKKACPSGWRLPTKNEFDQLLTATGAGSNSSSIRASSWENGSDSSGFGALPAGGKNYDGYFDYFGSNALFWSATPYDSDDAYYLYVSSGLAGVYYRDVYSAFSVRCIRDAN